MTPDSALRSVVLLIVGAAIGFIPTFLNECAKRRHALAIRWDVPLFDLCKGLTAAARQLQYLSSRLDRVQDKESQQAQIDHEHLILRSLVQQVRLIGSKEVQVAAQEVQHQA